MATKMAAIEAVTHITMMTTLTVDKWCSRWFLCEGSGSWNDKNSSRDINKLKSYILQTDVAFQLEHWNDVFGSWIFAMWTIFLAHYISSKLGGDVVKITRTFQRVVFEFKNVELWPWEKFVVEVVECIVVQVELVREKIKIAPQKSTIYLFQCLVDAKSFSVNIYQKGVIRKTQLLQFRHGCKSGRVDVLKHG